LMAIIICVELRWILTAHCVDRMKMWWMNNGLSGQ
jgi:hypothetical protein